jgi:translation initiation factor IF-3
MRTSRCLFNSAIALRKVFLSNAAALEAPSQLQRLLLPALTIPRQPSFPSSLSRRAFSTTHVTQLKYRRSDAKAGLRGDNGSAQKDRVRNYEIAFPWIQVRDESGALGEPVRTTQVLKSLNLEDKSLILLAVPKAEGPQYPICRIIDRAVERAEQADKDAVKKKSGKIVTKEMELNWAIAPHDLRTKTAQLTKFLSKGYQVRVTLLNLKKRNKRRATMDEAKVALQGVLDAIAEVPGAKETRAREGQVGETLILLLHAPTGSAADVSASEAASATETPAATGAAVDEA